MYDINYNPTESIQSFIDDAKELKNKYLYDTIVECLEIHRWRENLNVDKILLYLTKIKNICRYLKTNILINYTFV